ncbi:MAG: carboxypeptidase-like regulatory domain-containing protein [Chitinophagaceae bacterium]
MKLNVFKSLLLAVTAISLLFSACRRHNYGNQVSGTPYDNSKMIVASVAGFITDEQGSPIENASVRTGNNTTMTDANGYYYFKNITTPEHATTIHASKPDFFEGSRSFMAKLNHTHTASFTLLSKGTPQTFTSSNGGTVAFAGGLSFTFSANSVVNKNTGAAYAGQVFVYAKKIDPTTQLGQSSMPGDLRGLTATNSEERMLQSFGMSVTELYAADGSPLQVADNSEVTMSLEVPATLVANAPASIPLWYYDSAKEMWVEDGYATLQGNKYVGKVTHFSFWNCDTPQAANITIEMTLQDQLGNPLQGYIVKLKNTANNDTRHGTTDNLGWVGGLCYSNATLQMDVYPPYANNSCSNVSIYTQTINTSSSNLNLGTITIPLSGPSTCVITGNVVDCNNNIIANTPVFAQSIGMLVYTDAAGSFTYTMPCVPSGSVDISAYDLSTSVYGSINTTLVAGVNNVGTVTACGSIIQFLTLTLTNTVTSAVFTHTYLLPTETGFVTDSTTSSTITMYGNGTQNYLGIDVAGAAVGTFNVNYFNFYYFSTPSLFPDFSFGVNSGSSVTYTTYPAIPGSDAIGSFNLDLTGTTTSNLYTASGTFRLPKQ